ncbi:MAG: AzlC family ABC transporter permease [Methanobrevibacter sp.]|uniref:AzlC family ABC transporter permease n=1 Tax=Methanobrevibacter TaxID=2172 RepID=UPI002580D8F2|nr:AzlC family ABC transporter permease [Methanobrevibacter sp.]MBR2665952.1 AzlC family ABC transporter permease [Methanobrevibacter sp.]MBR6928459.1 AzlC family ABC transporter permease [Methanobrevibacter sp.]MBR7051068.1 AzlC family ABC transporter permease [Methanobrevibacter sp.]
MSRREKFIDGCRKGIPITFGYVPMGIGYAAIAIKAGMTPLQTVSMSVLVYAGAGQIIAASMLLSGATAMAIILTNFVVNLRYFVMSTCVLNQVEESNTPLNILAAHVTVDESFAMFSLSEDSNIWIYLGIAIIAWLSWILGAGIGVVVLDLLPVIVTNSFNISLYALFVAILIPSIKESKQIALLVLITAVLNVVLGQFLGNWSLIVSTLVGAAIGMYIVDDEYILGGDA